MKTSKTIPSALLVAVVGALEMPAKAQDQAASAEKKETAPAGLLPVPDYSGDFWTRGHLTGDWGGVRTDLANKGVQFEIDWNQYVQGVADGGRDRTTEYGGNLDYLLNLDLMRMGLLKGALIKFRAESRYGNSVNGVAGPILPVNTDALFPLTDELDEDIAFTITDLNYTQFLSERFGVFVGKGNTLDADLNEFASGRGTRQFMNANFVFNPAVALRLPYSTLAAGIVWMPIPPGPKGGVTFSSMVLNTADSSTTTGFEDFGKGTSWTAEVDLQYRLGHLPGGMSIGGLYSFDQEFARLNNRLTFEPGVGLTVPTKDSTWAVYWSAWQYLFAEPAEDHAIDLLNGQPDRQGVGLFARFGFADEETNPVEWAASGGVGGRGVIPTRDNDTFGIGYYYNKIQTTRLFSVLGAESSAQGFEAFYNIAITPALRATLDVQVVEPATENVDTATVLGFRATLVF